MTALHFLGPDGTLPRFPTRSELQRVGNTELGPNHLDEFVHQAWEARARLWVLDGHFWPNGFRALELVLSLAKIPDVRIISARDPERDKHLSDLHKVSRASWQVGKPSTSRGAARVRIDWRDRLIRNPPRYPFAHDRFVVLDESLWHFGYAAGGSGNCLSAASGPWSARDTRAIEFYEELWESLA